MPLLPLLESLSLLPVHAAATSYLRPDMGFGGSPISRKRWSQIRNLTIHMDSFQYRSFQAASRLPAELPRTQKTGLPLGRREELVVAIPRQ